MLTEHPLESQFPLPVKTLIEQALLEDLAQGDVTTDNIPELSTIQCKALIRNRERCVVSGLALAAEIVQAMDSSLTFEARVQEGDAVAAGTELASIEGSMASILKAERTVLNFLQHLCGVATTTRQYVEALNGTSAKLAHTRKTTPGLRFLEQQAVLHGGGSAHRFNLGSAVMLKDNHLQALGKNHPEPIAEAVQRLRLRIAHTTKIEVEVESLEQARQAVEAGVDIILLDNMSPDQVREAVALIHHRALVEVSGGITLETIRAYAEAGADIISTSKITLGVPAIDIGLDLS